MGKRSRTLLWVGVILVGSYAAEFSLMVVLGHTIGTATWNRPHYGVFESAFVFSLLFPLIRAVKAWRIALLVAVVGIGLTAAGLARRGWGWLALVGAGIMAAAWAALGLAIFRRSLISPAVGF
jgi:hypothetical protein